MTNLQTKTCSKCKVEKTVDAFRICKSTTSGLSTWCKACGTAQDKARYNKIKDERNKGKGIIIDLAGEIWKDIQDYKGLYQVSNLGRIKSLNGVRSKVIKPANVNNYCQVGLYKDGVMKLLKVHRLVALAFIPNTLKDKTEVNHINGNKGDNNILNLEWCTPKENSIHAHNTGLINNNNRSTRNFVRQPVQQIKDKHIIATFHSAMQVQQTFGYYASRISACARGVSKTAYGFEWRFA